MNPGRDDLAVGVDRARRDSTDLADGRDAAVLYSDVAAVRGLAGAVDDARVLDDEVIGHCEVSTLFDTTIRR